MDTKCSLYCYAKRNNIEIDCFHMRSGEALSISINGSCAIAIDPQKIKSTADETVKIAHELGHCQYGGFYCMDSSLDMREQHEYKANAWAVKKMIPWGKLKKAVVSGMQLWELADYFDVTEPFMKWAIEYYTERKGYSFEHTKK